MLYYFLFAMSRLLSWSTWFRFFVLFHDVDDTDVDDDTEVDDDTVMVLILLLFNFRMWLP
jgi:hypothetical protein